MENMWIISCMINWYCITLLSGRRWFWCKCFRVPGDWASDIWKKPMTTHLWAEQVLWPDISDTRCTIFRGSGYMTHWDGLKVCNPDIAQRSTFREIQNRQWCNHHRVTCLQSAWQYSASWVRELQLYKSVNWIKCAASRCIKMYKQGFI